MKKKIIISALLSIFLILLFVISLYAYQDNKGAKSSEVISDLQGTLFYIERVDGVRTLFKSDAELKSKTLIYSHKGKGKDNSGGYNDNISNFYYEKASKTIYFTAMDNGSWSLFSIKEGENKPVLLQNQNMEINTDYIHNQFNDLTATNKQGSLYLLKNGRETLINQFNGIYYSTFTGYAPIGFSPDGRFLVYYSREHVTPFGTLLEEFIKGSAESAGRTYIMDLSTMKSARFIDAYVYEIQWVFD